MYVKHPYLYLSSFVLYQNVTRPAKIGHICTQKLVLFLKFNLQYLLKYTSYDNEIFMPSSQINKKAKKICRT